MNRGQHTCIWPGSVVLAQGESFQWAVSRIHGRSAANVLAELGQRAFGIRA